MTFTEYSVRLLRTLIRAGHLLEFEELPTLLAQYADAAGLRRPCVFVIDLQENVLREVTGRGPDAGEGGQELHVDSTVAGRVFRKTRSLSLPASGLTRHWLPILDSTERLGVFRVDTEPDPDQRMLELIQDVASIIGMILISKRHHSDCYARLTRSRPLNVTAEMQWTLAPPRTFSNQRVTIAATMEPAYATAGDAFDYAVADNIVHLAIFDAMGHDTSAGLTANLAVACSRSERRKTNDLIQTCAAIEKTLLKQFIDSRFVTALLANLDLRSGMLTWLTCGHEPPVLIRDGRRVTHPVCPPAPPLGTDLGVRPTLCHEQLQPGDRLLLYTDGITEAQDVWGREFGLDQFVDFIIRHQADGMPAPETLRRLVRAVLQYHDGQLDDDATVLMCEWHGNIAALRS